MNILRKLERNLLTSIIVAIVSILGFIASSFLIYSESKDIPLGFLLSGGVIGGLYLIAHLLTSKDDEKSSNVRSIISIIIRFVVLVATVILLGFAYYVWDFKYFNVFIII